jgi:myo-inositol-1-phosphate synthase
MPTGQKNTPVEISAATGKLGILVVGLGAVATTFIAGVEAVRKGISSPIGSLTQMGTIRLGKRTDGRSPLIKDFVPLADLNDLVFGGWDIFTDSAYEAAANAQVLNPQHLQQFKPFLDSIKPMPAVFDKNYVKLLDGPNVRHPELQEAARLLAPGDDLVRLDRELPEGKRDSRLAGGL